MHAPRATLARVLRHVGLAADEAALSAALEFHRGGGGGAAAAAAAAGVGGTAAPPPPPLRIAPTSRTAPRHQVRRPLHGESVGAWRWYFGAMAAHLETEQAAAEEAAVALDGGGALVLAEDDGPSSRAATRRSRQQRDVFRRRAARAAAARAWLERARTHDERCARTRALGSLGAATVGEGDGDDDDAVCAAEGAAEIAAAAEATEAADDADATSAWGMRAAAEGASDGEAARRSSTAASSVRIADLEGYYYGPALGLRFL